MICPVEIASDMSAWQAAGVGEHGRHVLLGESVAIAKREFIPNQVFVENRKVGAGSGTASPRSGCHLWSYNEN